MSLPDRETPANNKRQVIIADEWWKKAARASAWFLLAGIVVLIVSGWGITQTGVIYRLSGGLIDRRLADEIHRAANVPVAFFFLSHVFINIGLMINRKKPSVAWWTAAALMVIGVGLMVIMVYMEYIRKGG
jgi:hypothetical protein